MFERQTIEIAETLSESEAVHRLVEAIGDDINTHTEGYASIREQVTAAEQGAGGAAHSARVLSQLGTYLRTGGQELSHVVDTFAVSEERLPAGLTRKGTADDAPVQPRDVAYWRADRAPRRHFALRSYDLLRGSTSRGCLGRCRDSSSLEFWRSSGCSHTVCTATQHKSGMVLQSWLFD